MNTSLNPPLNNRLIPIDACRGEALGRSPLTLTKHFNPMLRPQPRSIHPDSSWRSTPFQGDGPAAVDRSIDHSVGRSSRAKMQVSVRRALPTASPLQSIGTHQRII